MRAIAGSRRIARAFAAILVPPWCVALATPVSAAGSLACTVTGSSVAFGSVDVLPGTAVQTGGTLTVTCLSLPLGTGTLYVCVALSTRALQSATGGTLSYDIDEPGTSTPWSSTAPVAMAAASLVSSVSVPFTAVLAGRQTGAAPGSYSQTLVATAYLGTSGCTTGSTLTVGLSFAVSATVLKSCNVSATALSFGTTGSLAVPVDGQSTLSIACTSGTPYTVALNGGLSGVADPTARLMTSNSGAIAYGLYQNAGRSVPWGTASSATLGGTGTATTQTVPVYGRVSAQPTPQPGTYSDTVVVTITY